MSVQNPLDALVSRISNAINAGQNHLSRSGGRFWIEGGTLVLDYPQLSPEEQRRDDLVRIAMELVRRRELLAEGERDLEACRKWIRDDRIRLGPFADALPGDELPEELRLVYQSMVFNIQGGFDAADKIPALRRRVELAEARLNELAKQDLTNADLKALIQHQDKAVRVIGMGLAARIRGGQASE